MTEQLTEAPTTELSRQKLQKPTGKTKVEILRRLLSRQNGATVVQVQNQLGWQPHTVRAAISRLRSSGLSVELDQSGKAARYRVVSGKDR
jgi:predicted ArsR family transcriptional regulator